MKTVSLPGMTPRERAVLRGYMDRVWSVAFSPDGNLALMECTDAITHVPRFVICAVGRDKGDYVFTPFGHLAEGNPLEAYVPPEASDAAGSAASP